MIAYGPVPSRRLGKSLGVNNIPPKVCTYSCIYCQLGKTVKMRVKPQSYYRPERVVDEVEDKVKKASACNEPVDYITYVPDGEPTLDRHLGDEIARLRTLGAKIAVITNASLLWRSDVRESLFHTDWVSLKLDALDEGIWRGMDRPHRDLKLDRILEGILAFSKGYGGELVTESMLVRDVNDSADHLKDVADFLAILNPSRAYISIPIRPPAEDWARPATEQTVNHAYQVFSRRICDVECLTGYEGNAFANTGGVEEDLLSITSVHPMREDAVREFLERAHADWSVMKRLMQKGRIVRVSYEEKNFYIRRLHRRTEG